jgi:SAM-dependent MidA family methyltransferase
MDITLTSLETAHTELLSQKIMAEIASHGGWMAFSRYMEMALYEPGMGYYSAGAHKLGAGGDFTTAPELSPLFGAAIVETLLPILEGLKAQGLPIQILEFGAGTGKLAESILTRLHDLDFELDRYDIIEISPDLAQRQELRIKTLSEKLSLSTQCDWLSSLPSHFNGIILANEVIDAIPFDAIIYQKGFWYCQGVAVVDGKFAWAAGKPVEQSLLPEALLTGNFSEGYVTELHTPGYDK